MAGKIYNLDVASDVARLQKEIKNLATKQIKASAKTASNNTMKIIAKKWLHNVAAKTRIKQKLLKNRLKYVKATARFASAIVYFKAHGVPWILLGARGLKRKSGIKSGKRYEPSGFVATMPSGRVGAFKRVGENRLPIRELKVDISGAIEVTQVKLQRLAKKIFVIQFNKVIQKRIAKEFS